MLIPLFHHLNLNDNLIIMLSSVSSMAAQVVQNSAVEYSTVQYMTAQVARALATSPRTFYSSICLEVAGDLHSPPIRAQMTRCILPQETGKVVR